MHPTPRFGFTAHSALRQALGTLAPLRAIAGCLFLFSSLSGAQAAAASQERGDMASARADKKTSERTFDLQAAVDEMVAALDLGRPGLEAVTAARASGDKAAVRRALADYLPRLMRFFRAAR